MIGFFVRDSDGHPLSIQDNPCYVPGEGDRVWVSSAESFQDITWFDSPMEAEAYAHFGQIEKATIPGGLGLRVGLKQAPGNHPVLAIGSGPMAVELGYIPDDREPSDTTMVDITEKLINVSEGMFIRDQVRHLYKRFQ